MQISLQNSTERSVKMTRKKKPILLKRSVVMDLVSHLKDLPSRDTNANNVMNLTQIFHAEDFKKEVESLLERGYSHTEIATIINEKCGILVSERQVKYHCTRAANRTKRGKKGAVKATKKGGEKSNKPEQNVEIPKLKVEEVSSINTKISIDCDTTSPAEDTEKVTASSQYVTGKAGSFSVNMQKEEI